MLNIDSSGNIINQKAFGFNDSLQLQNIENTNDGGFIMGGIIGISNEKKYYAIKLEANTNIIWSRNYGGNMNNWLQNIQIDTNGGYLLSGTSNSNSVGDKSEDSQGGFDYWIIKTDEAGEIIWENTIGGSKDEQAEATINTSDGKYLVGGWSYSNISGDKTEDQEGGEDFTTDYWLLKLNEQGIIEGQESIGGFFGETLCNVLQKDDGTYVMAGISNSNISGDKSEDSRGNYDY